MKNKKKTNKFSRKCPLIRLHMGENSKYYYDNNLNTYDLLEAYILDNLFRIKYINTYYLIYLKHKF